MKDRKPRMCHEGGEPLEGKHVLEYVLRSLNIHADNPKAAVGFEWQKIIGNRLYPHVKIVEIKGTTLVLRADHPSWAQMAMMQQKKILAFIGKKYPSLGIKSIQMLSS
ncbi:MAG: DUF721 domain-containing protein [Spirochaetia bacterium]|nr:DUF721 domain-containing protein [Spirochaetia bacterium]NCC89280.1 DUF721 domain-containing protein [Spirochaetia bacterium]